MYLFNLRIANYILIKINKGNKEEYSCRQDRIDIYFTNMNLVSLLIGLSLQSTTQFLTLFGLQQWFRI